MKTVWTAGLSEEQKRIVTQEFKGSPAMRDRLTEMIQTKINSAFTESRSKDGYSDPSWAYKQADFLGYMRGLQEILKLIEKN